MNYDAGRVVMVYDRRGRGRLVTQKEDPELKRMALIQAIVALAAGVVPAVTAGAGDDAKSKEQHFRGLLGSNSWKVRVDGSKTYLWAGGDHEGPNSQWYDFTGSPIPAAELQFGIGKDRIRAIDDPYFVSPDDRRILELGRSPYRRDERPKTNDETMVIGYVEKGEARAYPIALLDGHELVNDKVGGKPVTVGW